MSEISSKLFREDPALYYTELGAQYERERIIRLIQETYSDPTNTKWGSLEWTGDIIALIKGEQK